MALSIGVSKGSKIDIAGHVLEVKDIAKGNLIVVSIDGGNDKIISEQASIEVLPEVFVFAGIGPGGSSNRLAFTAKRSIPIHRIEAKLK